jgi:hypothetical protein
VGAEFVEGAPLGAGAAVGPAATVAGALPVSDGGGAATDGAGAGRADGVELAAAGGGSRREGAVPGDEPVGGVFGALPEHPPANKARATATGTTILRIGPSPRDRSAISGWLHSSLWLAIADPQAPDFSTANSRWRRLSGPHHPPAHAVTGRRIAGVRKGAPAGCSAMT